MVELRKCERFIVPGATVTFRTPGWFGKGKTYPDEAHPVGDLSKGGISFLTDEPPRKGAAVVLLLTLPDEEAPIELSGTVVHSLLNPGISYRYRVGIKFEPFGVKDGNTSDGLTRLANLEKAYGQNSPGRYGGCS
jgi:hypothetical protein